MQDENTTQVAASPSRTNRRHLPVFLWIGLLWLVITGSALSLSVWARPLLSDASQVLDSTITGTVLEQTLDCRETSFPEWEDRFSNAVLFDRTPVVLSSIRANEATARFIERRPVDWPTKTVFNPTIVELKMDRDGGKWCLRDVHAE